MKSIRRFFEGMGIWVAFMPFLHFPTSVRNGLYAVTGVTIFLGAYLYLRKRIATAKDKVEPTFVESIPEKAIVEKKKHAAPRKHDQDIVHRYDAAKTEIESVPHNSAPQISGIETLE
jgi:hypothetical protein